jgi:predicted nucleic acid-binding protein
VRLVLIDSSALIEFLRARSSPARLLVRDALLAEEAFITDAVILEVLAGARLDDVADTRRLLSACDYLGTWPRDDWEGAAAIYRRCRQEGFTPGSRIDCLITAVALRNAVPVLHHDADFDGIAACTGLEVVSGL